MDISYLTKEQADHELNKIKPASFTSSPKPPQIKKTSSKGQKIPDSLEPKFRHKAIVKYREVKAKLISYIIPMKKIEKAIRNKVTDSTWYGKVLFAVLDVLPLPNVHEVWKAVQKELPDAPMKEKVKLFWVKIDGLRTVVAIAISLASYYQLHN